MRKGNALLAVLAVLVVTLAPCAGGADTLSRDDVRLTCEWIVFLYRLETEVYPMLQKPAEMMDAAVNAEDPSIAVARMESAFREAERSHRRSSELVATMRQGFRSAEITDACDKTSARLLETASSVAKCVAIFEAAAGDPLRLMARESDMAAAIDEVARINERINAHVTDTMPFACASRLLAQMNSEGK